MKKLIALGSLVGLPTILSVGHTLPGIVTILLFSTSPAGVLASLGIGAALFGTAGLSPLFTYFVSSAFAPPTAISNWIIGL